MYWTLVVMTLGGTPIPTDLVFDSIEACYEAEAEMTRERTRYATEWGARSSDSRQLPEFVRQNLVRGVCVPHSITGKTDNLPAKPKVKAKLDPDRLYRFSARPRPNNRDIAEPPVEVFMSPIVEYELPRVPMAFRIIVRNLADHAVSVRNPLQSFILQVQRSDGYPIKLPDRVPDIVAQRMDVGSDRVLRGSSFVLFRTAIVNGREDPVERNLYSIGAGSSLEFVFECEKVVSEEILAAFHDFDDAEDEQHVNVTALMNVFQSDPYGAMSYGLEEKIRLPFPKP